MVNFNVGKEESHTLYEREGTQRKRNNRNAKTEQGREQAGKQKLKNGALFAGDSSLQNDTVLLKKIKAGKDAMKGVLEQFKADRKIDSNLEERSQKIKSKQMEMTDVNDKIQELNKQKEDLKQAYGITEDGPINEDYEQIVQGYDNMIEHYQEDMDKALDTINSESRIIKSTKQSLLSRKHDMGDEIRTEEEIRKSAGKEIIGELFKESIEQTDKEVKEEKEAEEKKAEKKEAEEEARKAAEQKQKEAEERIENMEKALKEEMDRFDPDSFERLPKIEETVEEMQQEIQNIMEKSKLLNEDMKGIVLDKQV